MIQKNYYLLFINLGAIDIENEDVKFNQYFEPTCHISWSSSQVTGLTVNGLDLQNLVEEFLPNNSCRYHDAFEDAKNLGAIIGEACKKKEISIREFLQVKHKNLYLLE